MTDKMKKKAGEEFVRLIEIMDKLRAPDGCPWDREQTHESLRPYLEFPDAPSPVNSGRPAP